MGISDPRGVAIQSPVVPKKYPTMLASSGYAARIGSKFSDLMSCIDIWLALVAFMPLVLRKPCQPPLVLMFLRFESQALNPVAQRLMIGEPQHLGCSDLAVTRLFKCFGNVAARDFVQKSLQIKVLRQRPAEGALVGRLDLEQGARYVLGLNNWPRRPDRGPQ